ncbi:MAG: aldo/keto reductase [bacterium]|nr:aldo/keto reductase [bacterium]
MAAQLRQKALGGTGVTVTELGVGGYIGALTDASATDTARQDAAIVAVQRAIHLGVRYFDTSPAYGTAERYLGAALATLPADVRARLTVSTKVGTHPERPNAYGAADVRWCLAQSAHMLGRIDMVYVHDPVTDAHMDAILAPGGAFEALEQLKAAGEIRGFGLGVRRHHFLLRAIDSGRVDVILPSYDYHPIRQSLGPVLDAAIAAGVAVVNGSPYQAGLLAGADLHEAAKRRPPDDADLARAQAIVAWCAQRHIDVGALAVQFSLRDRRIGATLVGPRTVDEVESGVRHATEPIPASVWDELGNFLAHLQPAAAPGGEASQ